MSFDSPLKYSSEREQYLLLSQQLRKLEDMFDLQQSDHQQLLKSIEDLQSKIEALTEENTHLHDLLSETGARSQEMEAEVVSLRTLLDKKEAMVSRLREEIKSATFANAKSVEEHQLLQQQVISLNQDQEKLLRDYEVLMDQCDRVTALLDQQTTENTHLKGDLDSATVKWTQTQRDIEAQTRRANDAEYLMTAVQTKYEAAVLTIKDLKKEVEVAKEMALQAQQDVRRLHEAKEESQQRRKAETNDLEVSITELRLLLAKKDEELQSSVIRIQQLQSALQGASRSQGQVAELSKALEAKESTLMAQEQDLQLLERANRDLEAENRSMQKELRAQSMEMTKMAHTIDSLRHQQRALEKSEDSLKRYLEKKERMLDMRAQAEAELRSALESADLAAKRLV